MSFPALPLRSALVAAVLCASLFGAPAALAVPPDLVASAINAPNIVEEGTEELISVAIHHAGDPATLPYTFEVLLSTDFTLGPEDVLCGTFQSSTFGLQHVTIRVPEDTPSQIYNWAVRVTPDPREVVFGNNVVFGIPAGVLHIDLCVAGDANPVAVTAFVNGPSPAPVQRYVANCGSNNSILVFSAVETPDVPWLSVSPPNNFAIAGNVAQPTVFTFDTTSLPLGQHATAVRFTSFTNPAEFVEMPVTVNVIEPEFEPGDRLMGSIDAPFENDQVIFRAVKGEKVVVKVASPTGNAAPMLELLDSQNAVLKTMKFKHKAKAVKKTLKIPVSGEFRLRVSGQKGTTGAYEIATSRKLPKGALPRKLKLKGKSGTSKVDATVLALPGCLLDLKATPGKKFTGPIDVGVLNPQGASLSLAGFSMVVDGAVAVDDLPFAQVGGYVVSVLGFGGKGQLATLDLKPLQPPQGTSTIFLP